MFEETIAVSRRLIEEGFNEGNLDLIDELCSDDLKAHDPILGDHDRETAKQAMAGYRQAFPDLEFRIEDCFAAGDKVVVRWTATGTFENELMGQEPTGERGNPVEGVTIDRFEDGLVAETWTQWDALQLMRNIGAVPEGAAAA